MSIAFLDVDYRGTGARAACVVTDGWAAAAPSATWVRDIESVQPYEPGQFYRRELPCLLAVLALLPALPDAMVIDGYVWLAAVERPGLGAHLHAALGGRVPVVGIAKSAFAGAESSPVVVPVLRGASKQPLFVSSIGLPLDVAAGHVRRMAGKHRMPGILRITDTLARSTGPACHDQAATADPSR